MRKYNILSLISLLMFLFCSLAYSQTENITITTYYPAPYGEYQQVKLTPTTQPACAAGNKGAIYYDNDPAKNKPYICDGTKWTPLGSGISQCITVQHIKEGDDFGYATCPSNYPIMLGGGCYFSGESGSSSDWWRDDNNGWPSFGVAPGTYDVSGTGDENTWYCEDRTGHADVAYAYARCCK